MRIVHEYIFSSYDVLTPPGIRSHLLSSSADAHVCVLTQLHQGRCGDNHDRSPQGSPIPLTGGEQICLSLHLMHCHIARWQDYAAAPATATQSRMRPSSVIAASSSNMQDHQPVLTICAHSLCSIPTCSVLGRLLPECSRCNARTTQRLANDARHVT